MRSRIILLPTLFFCLFHLSAQEKLNMKLGMEMGLIPFADSGNAGLFFSLEPKLIISSNAVMGMRIGLTLNSQTFENREGSQFIIDEASDNGFLSIVPTFGYHWNIKNFRPYLGAGIGPCLLANSIDVSQTGTVNPEVFEVRINYQAGFLVRGGVEWGKSNIGVEYNFIPRAEIETPNDQKIGTVMSSYLALTMGLTIGG